MQAGVSAGICCGEFWLGGEALLLRPTVYRPYSAIESGRVSVITPQEGRWVGKTKPPYTWGYRIEVGYQRGCWDTRANWSSWIHTNTFDLSVDDSRLIWLTYVVVSPNQDFVSPGRMIRKDHFKFQSIDAEFSRWLGEPCSLWSHRLLGGVRYARIRYDTLIDVTGINDESDTTSIFNRWDSDALGIGPRAGIENHLRLCWGFHLSGDASVALLLGTIKGRYYDEEYETEAGGGLEFVITSERMLPANLVLPNGEIKLGVGHCLDMGIAHVETEVSYQISYYPRGRLRSQYFDARTRINRGITRIPFALDGWAFHLTGRF